MNNFDIQILLIFREIFKGHKELGNKILDILKKIDIEYIRKDYIETHFYNWLICDICMRDYNLYDNEYYKIFYNKNKEVLGLNEKWMRTKGLNNCFESKWWKVFPEKHLKWKNIHNRINSKIKINLSTIPVNLDNNTEIILVSHLWRDVTLIEKIKILDDYYNYYRNIIDENIVEIYISCDYNSMCYLC